MNRGKCLIYFILLFVGVTNTNGQATSSVNITLTQLDSIFLAQNLELLAERCNVDASKAMIQQSKLWNNPNLILNQAFYNGLAAKNGGQKWFDTSDKGETSVQISQLITIAGKRNKQINLAKLNSERAEQNYFDLMRSLKYSLHTNFFTIYYLQHIVDVYDKEIASLQKLIDVFEEQYQKGYLSKKEILRLKSSLFSIESERIDYQTQLTNALAELNLMLHTQNNVYQPVIGSDTLNSISSLNLSAVIDSALLNRYDLKMAQSDVQISQMNIAYQRALAVPDVNVIAGWDKNGGIYRNYNYVGVQIDLPFFNRNKGNIKAAKFAVDASQYNLQRAEEQVKSDVMQAYALATENEKMYKKFDKTFIDDIDHLSAEMLKNYEKKNIGLVEFLDYYDAFKDNAVQINMLKMNRMNALENLNFSVGKNVLDNK